MNLQVAILLLEGVLLFCDERKELCMLSLRPLHWGGETRVGHSEENMNSVTESLTGEC